MLFAVLFPLVSQRPKTTEAAAVNKSAVATTKAPAPVDQTRKPKEEAQAIPQEVKEVAKPQIPQTTISLSKQEIMTAAGIPQSEWAAVDYIISHESGWRPCVVNGGEINCSYTGTRAYGLCQSLPASKMSSAGGDYMTNPVTQMKWCSNYAQTRYGGWWGAYNAWTVKRWW